VDSAYYEEKKEKARQIYDAHRSMYSPYFKDGITLNSDGFHHLRYSARRERNKEEQILKFTLLPLGLQILKTATTVQEYRKLLMPVGEKARRDGAVAMKLVEWWGFVAILTNVTRDIKVRVIVRKVGDGNLHFWSVMPYSKLRRGEGIHQKMYTGGIEDE
jgi:hypothetical protein